MVRVLFVIALVGACTRTSEKYCGLHPEDLANCPPSDAPIDARPTCASDPQCPGTAPRCLLEGAATGVCVGCLTNADCTQAGKQACDPDLHECRSCVEHKDCLDSQACLPDGTCGTNDSVIYVDPASLVEDGDCPVTAPCKTITHALTQVTPMRYHMKLTGVITETVTITGKRVVILADPGTKLTGLADPTLKIQMGTVTVYDLEIPCAVSPAMTGIKSEMGSTTVLRNVWVHGCGKLGVEGKGGFLNVSRSRVGENIDGGIVLDASAAFSITNTIIYRNGDAAATKGGFATAAVTAGMVNRFEHNTVVDNVVKPAPTVGGGVTCTATNFMELQYNLIAGNTPPNTVGCDPLKSKLEADSATLMFRSTAPPYDYHLTAGSTGAIDEIDTSGLPDDVDGQFRPQGPKKDFGADEYKP